MPDIEKFLSRWQSAGLLDSQAATRIRAWEEEQKHPSLPPRTGPGLAWQGVFALILGGILLATGIILFCSAHWETISPGLRFTLLVAMVTAVHVAGGMVRERSHAFCIALHATGTVATCSAIVVASNIFAVEDHWPAAVLMFSVAALAGWALLRDQAHQAITLLLIPAWIFLEIGYYTQHNIGQVPYLGRFLFVWAIFYLTMLPDSTRKTVHWILFSAAALAAAAGVEMMTVGWTSYSSTQTFIAFGTRLWAWAVIAAVPLAIAAFRGHWGLIPLVSAISLAIALPWCTRLTVEHVVAGTVTRTEPNMAAQSLTAAFTIFLIGWGMRRISRSLVNLGMAGFALVIAWFYFSNLYGKVGRALFLIGLGVLFLAGGWALEVWRRRLLARMRDTSRTAVLEAK